MKTFVNDRGVSDKVKLLYLLVMSIPLTKMIENVASNPEYNRVLRFIILLLIIVEWIYSQASFTDEYEYTPNQKRLRNVAAVFLEVGVCVSAGIAAYQIGSEKCFYAFITLFFLLDLFTQLVTRPDRTKKIMYKVTKAWIILDVLEFSFFAAAIICAYFGALGETCRSTALAIVVIALTLYDFIYNGDFYFGKEGKN